jgi:uncharacterized protein YkwD
MKATVLSAVAVAGAAAALVAAPVGAGASAGLLARSGACPAADALASPAVQRRALVCLVNWARVRAGVAPLRRARALERSAHQRAERMVACDELSPAPCGERLPAAVTTRSVYLATGENLYSGSGGSGTPYDVVAGWLRSPTHRALLLGGRWRELGTAVVRVDRFEGSGQVAIWVLHVGTRL